MIDSGINAGPRSTLRGSDLRISAGITRGIDARYARRILTGGISSGWNWCLSRTRGHGYRESCIFTQLRSVARFSPEHRIARTKCRLISTDLWFIGFLPLSLPFDYANDRRVKIPGNILPPFDATNLFISRYCSSDFLFFVNRRNSWKNWILKIGEKKTNQAFIDSDLWVFSWKFNGEPADSILGRITRTGMSVNPQWSPIYRVSLTRLCALSFADVSIHRHGKSGVKAPRATLFLFEEI